MKTDLKIGLFLLLFLVICLGVRKADPNRETPKIFQMTRFAPDFPAGNIGSTRVLKDKAFEAFLYLNKFRSNPAHEGELIGLDFRNVKKSKILIWDPILSKEAEKKAIDMASRNYFDHLDPDGYGMNYWVAKAGFPLPVYWSKEPGANMIESIAANNKSPDHFIELLIVDYGEDSKLHRKHLLATTPFFQKATHAGIGITYNPNSEYGYYCCVLISPKGN